MRKLFAVFVFILIVASGSFAQQSSLSYIALGDSYTIGEKVEKNQRWPMQLVDSLQNRGFKISDPKIIAKTGWTTDELQNGISKEKLNPTYDLVSLLIGVNNQYRGYDIEQFRKEFTELLEQSISLAGGNRESVFVVSIPDYGVTPFGQQKNPEKIAQEIKKYNRISREISKSHNVTFINITPISKKAKNDSSLVARDGLHPSGKMYSLWVEKIIPEIITKLK